MTTIATLDAVLEIVVRASPKSKPLTLRQLRTLLLLARGQPATISKIAVYLDASLPAASRVARELSVDGLVSTAPDATDGRRTLVTLTRRGWALIDKIDAAMTRTAKVQAAA